MAISPVPKPEPKKKNRGAWKRHEQRSANNLIRVDEPAPNLHKPRTGDVKGYGNDIESKYWSGECKHTSKKQYILKLEDIEKLIKRSKELGKKSLFNLQFEGKHFQLCFILWSELEEIISLQKEYYQYLEENKALKREIEELKLLSNNDTNTGEKLLNIKRYTDYINDNINKIRKEIDR